MKQLEWGRMNREQQEQFRRAYRVLYTSEEEFMREMERFDPKWQVIPEVSPLAMYRRALIGRIISGKRRDTDPYRTDAAFSFDDIKYFLGDDPIDLFFYGNHEPKVIRTMFRGTEFGYGSTEPMKLVKTALDNVGVPIGNAIFGAWDRDNHSNPILYYFHVNVEPERKGLPGPEMLDGEYFAPAQDPPKEIGKDYKGPLLVIQNKIAYGRKHDDMVIFLHSKNLGLDYKTLVFNFIGHVDFDPWSVPSYYMNNVLRLI